MTPLYTKRQFKTAKSRTKLPLCCEHCNTTFYLEKHHIMQYKPIGRGKYCTPECGRLSSIKLENITCDQCKSSFLKQPARITKHNFCSQSCAGTYSNTHKTYGYRRSKLEIWLENQLPILYPNLKFNFNDRLTLGAELDIYIPELKLAFELNGIFHYEPIFGVDKFNKIQNNDQRKFKLCIENNIGLCVIDTSSQKYFKEETSKKYLKIITDIIDSKNGAAS